MTTSQKIKSILLGIVFGLNLLLALCLYLCGITGNILFGILLIAFYRISLQGLPLAVIVICWLPLDRQVGWRKKLSFNLVLLVFSGLAFVLCRLLFGNWY